MDLLKKLKNRSDFTAVFRLQKETKEKIGQKQESLYSSLPTRIKTHYLDQVYTRMYTALFNRLIGEQFVLQHKHLLHGLGV